MGGDALPCGWEGNRRSGVADISGSPRTVSRPWWWAPIYALLAEYDEYLYLAVLKSALRR